MSIINKFYTRFEVIDCSNSGKFVIEISDERATIPRVSFTVCDIDNSNIIPIYLYVELLGASRIIENDLDCTISTNIDRVQKCGNRTLILSAAGRILSLGVYNNTYRYKLDFDFESFINNLNIVLAYIHNLMKLYSIPIDDINKKIDDDLVSDLCYNMP